MEYLGAVPVQMVCGLIEKQEAAAAAAGARRLAGRAQQQARERNPHLQEARGRAHSRTTSQGVCEQAFQDCASELCFRTVGGCKDLRGRAPASLRRTRTPSW